MKYPTLTFNKTTVTALYQQLHCANMQECATNSKLMKKEQTNFNVFPKHWKCVATVPAGAMDGDVSWSASLFKEQFGPKEDYFTNWPECCEI